jgi:hypothetical protein
MTLLLIAVLGLYLVSGFLNLPKPITFKEGGVQRVFTAYTEENIVDYIRILYVGLGVSVHEDNTAIGSMAIWLKATTSESHAFSLLFILPSNSDPILQSNQTATSSFYAKTVRTRVVVNSTTKIVETLFKWPTFSTSLRLWEWGFSIDVRSFHTWYDMFAGHTYYSLVNKNFEPFGVRVSVDLPGDSYRIMESYPSTGTDFGSSVAWADDQSVLFFAASGTYQHMNRYAVDFAISTFLPLVIGLIGGFLLGTLSDKSRNGVEQIHRSCNMAS